MGLTDNDKLNVALEIMGDKDVDKYQQVCKFLEENDAADIYEALEKVLDW